jgi:hypothetical protein
MKNMLWKEQIKIYFTLNIIFENYDLNFTFFNNLVYIKQ